MSSTPVPVRVQDRSGQRGAVVVEAALVISLVLAPILMGVITLGERLWAAQRTPPYDVRIAPSQIVGRFTCAELVDRVRVTVVNNSAALDAPLDAQSVAVDVVEVAPTVGVLVEVSVSAPPLSSTGSPVVAEAASRLEQVSLTTETCL